MDSSPARAWARPAAWTRGLGATGSCVALLVLVLGFAARTAPAQSLDEALAQLGQHEEAAASGGPGLAELAATWREIVSLLQAEASWQERRAEFTALAERAPAELERLRSLLATPEAAPPSPPETASAAMLEARRTELEAAAGEAERRVQTLQAERRERTSRRLALPGEISQLQRRLETAAGSGNGAEGETAPVALRDAQRTLAEVRTRALRAELQAKQAELESYRARTDLLTLRQDLAVRSATQLAAQLEALLPRLNELRVAEARDASQQAEEARRRLQSAPERVRALAADNEELAAERARLVARNQELAGEVESLRGEADLIESRWTSVRRRLEAAPSSQPAALLMRRHRAELPELRTQRHLLRQTRDETARSLVAQLEVEDERVELADLDAVRERELAAIRAATGVRTVDAELESTLTELLRVRRDLLDELHAEQGSQLIRLAEAEAARRRVIAAAEGYGSFVSERLLWLRASRLPRWKDLGTATSALAFLGSPSEWSSLLSAVGSSLLTRPWALVLSLGVLLPFVLRRLARRRLDTIGSRLASSDRNRFSPSLRALAWTLIAASPWPILFGWLSWLVASSAIESALGSSLAAGLARLSQWSLPVLGLRVLVRQQGLASLHFRWSAALVENLRRHWRLLALALPFLVLDAALEAQDRADFRDSLGRFGFCIGLVLLATYFHHALKRQRLGEDVGARLGRVFHAVAVGLPILLALAAVLGYTLGARELGQRMLGTFAVVLAIAVGHGLLERWLGIERRRLRLEEMRRFAAKAAASQDAPKTEVEPELMLEDEGLDVDRIDGQARQLLTAGTVVTLLICGWWLWSDLVPAARAAERVVLWSAGPEAEAAAPATSPLPLPGNEPASPTGSLDQVTLLDLLLAIALFGLTLFAAANLPGLLEVAVLRRLDLVPGTSYAVTALTRYAITLTGLIWAAGLIGITWGRVQWLAAAVTVGLGFGLQEIFANFVSGLIILFERPIRVGDIVTVGGVEGVVTRIRTRATTIRDWDRRELLVPNKEFITGQLINWSLTDPVTRVVVPVGIAYGSDTDLASQLLLKTAEEHPLVLTDPKPNVVFRAFGESSLDFQLRVFLPRYEVWPRVVHELHVAIDRAFRDANIEIAFPQRDLHVRSLPQGFELPGPTPPEREPR